MRHPIAAALVGLLLLTGAPDVAEAGSSCPTLRYGSSGQSVVELQYLLKAAGWTIDVDGQFGPGTEKVVRKLQSMSGLLVDGIVGPRTQAAVGCTETPTPAPGGYVHSNPDVERWHGLALQVGWKEADWRWLSCVIHRESKGQPGAYNGVGNDRSYGLTQLNTKDGLWSWFVRQGLTDRAQLHDAGTNLRIAKVMFDGRGKQPWRSSSRPC